MDNNLLKRRVLERIKTSNQQLAIARKFYANDNYYKALEYFNNSLKINPSNSDLYSERAECFYSLNNNNNFVRDLTYALTTNNCKELKYWENRLNGYHRIGENELARRDLEMIRTLFRGAHIKKYADILDDSNSAKTSDLSKQSIADEQNVQIEQNIINLGGNDNFSDKINRILSVKNEEESIDYYKINKLNIAKFKFLLIKLINTQFNEIYQIYNEKFDDIDDDRQLAFEKLIASELNTIESPELLIYYFQKFSKTNVARLHEALKKVKHLLDGKEIEVFDWGKGFHISASIFVEYARNNFVSATITRCNLIDTSLLTLYLQLIHLKLSNRNIKVDMTSKPIGEVSKSDLTASSKTCKVHLLTDVFSDTTIDYREIADSVSNLKGMNLFICTSSHHNDFKAMDKFYNEGFDRYKNELIAHNEKNILEAKWRGTKFSDIISSNTPENYFKYKENPYTRKEIIFYTNIR